MNNKSFQSKQNECTGSFIVESPVKAVFFQLCPTREYDWVPGWSCNLIWSKSGFAEKGAIFTTAHKGIGKETWVVSEYQPLKKIAFVRFSESVVIRLSFELKEKDGKTYGKLSQSKTSLNEAGDKYVDQLTDEANDYYIKALITMLSYYLKTGDKISENELKKHMHHQ
jgi:hypothetical protein